MLFPVDDRTIMEVPDRGVIRMQSRHETGYRVWSDKGVSVTGATCRPSSSCVTLFPSHRHQSWAPLPLSFRPHWWMFLESTGRECGEFHSLTAESRVRRTGTRSWFTKMAEETGLYRMKTWTHFQLSVLGDTPLLWHAWPAIAALASLVARYHHPQRWPRTSRG